MQLQPISRIVLSAMALAAVLAGCQVPPPRQQAGGPATPDARGGGTLAQAENAYASGVRYLETGFYDEAVKDFNQALGAGVLSREKQLEARKLLAISHCLARRTDVCKAEFRSLLDDNPQFRLTATENANPAYGPLFRQTMSERSAELELKGLQERLRTMRPAERLLYDASQRYDAGDYLEAAKLYQSAYSQGLEKRSDQIESLKKAAFSFCLAGRTRECRTEFSRVISIDPGFELTAAEAGHPTWGPVYRQVRQQQTRQR